MQIHATSCSYLEHQMNKEPRSHFSFNYTDTLFISGQALQLAAFLDENPTTSCKNPVFTSFGKKEKEKQSGYIDFIIKSPMIQADHGPADS